MQEYMTVDPGADSAKEAEKRKNSIFSAVLTVVILLTCLYWIFISFRDPGPGDSVFLSMKAGGFLFIRGMALCAIFLLPGFIKGRVRNFTAILLCLLGMAAAALMFAGGALAPDGIQWAGIALILIAIIFMVLRSGYYQSKAAPVTGYQTPAVILLFLALLIFNCSLSINWIYHCMGRELTAFQWVAGTFDCFRLALYRGITAGTVLKWIPGSFGKYAFWYLWMAVLTAALTGAYLFLYGEPAAVKEDISEDIREDEPDAEETYEGNTEAADEHSETSAADYKEAAYESDEVDSKAGSELQLHKEDTAESGKEEQEFTEEEPEFGEEETFAAEEGIPETQEEPEPETEKPAQEPESVQQGPAENEQESEEIYPEDTEKPEEAFEEIKVSAAMEEEPEPESESEAETDADNEAETGEPESETRTNTDTAAQPDAEIAAVEIEPADEQKISEDTDLRKAEASAEESASEDDIKPEKAMDLTLPESVSRYALNFASYMSLDHRKRVFRSEKTGGYISYNVIGREAIITGTPLCPTEDYGDVLSEFGSLCRGRGLSQTWINVPEKAAGIMKDLGYDIAFSGAEPIFELDNFKLTPLADDEKSKKAMLSKYHVYVREYRYYQKRDEKLEQRLNWINDEWTDSRNPDRFTVYRRRQRDAFLPRTLDFDHESGRRYYYASDASDHVLAFIVFCPIDSDRGYSCEAGRRVKRSPDNIMELIMYRAYAGLKAEGVRWAGMGLMPGRPENGDMSARQSRWIDFVYRYYQNIYSCRDYKEALPKYHPTRWSNVYLVTNNFRNEES